MQTTNDVFAFVESDWLCGFANKNVAILVTVALKMTLTRPYHSPSIQYPLDL